MKKITIAAFLCLPLFCMSQKLEYKGLQFGAGLHYTDIDVSKSNKNNIVKTSISPQLGYNAKITAALQYKQHKFNIGFTHSYHRVKGKFEGLGWGTDNVNGTYQPSITYRDAYVNNVGLLMTYILPIGKKNRFYASLNPYYIYSGKSNLYAIRISTGLKTFDETFNSSVLKTINVGMQLGYKLNVPIYKNIEAIIEPNINVLGLRERFSIGSSRDRVYFGGINLVFSQKTK